MLLPSPDLHRISTGTRWAKAARPTSNVIESAAGSSHEERVVATRFLVHRLEQAPRETGARRKTTRMAASMIFNDRNGGPNCRVRVDSASSVSKSTGSSRARSNGMDPSSPERHQRARLEVSSTSRRREEVHHEAYACWRRFGKDGLPGSWSRSERAGCMAPQADASELAQGIARDG